MYPAVVLTLLIMVFVECIHDQIDAEPAVAEPDRCLRSRPSVWRFWSSTMRVQLTFLQPALLLGETEGLSPWSQYNPHGVFIALENVGYGLLNLAFLFIGIAMLRTASRLWRAAACVFAVGGGLTLALLVLYSAFYQVRLDYRFEVTAIGVTWLVLIVAPVLLSIALVRTRPVKDQGAADPEISDKSLPR